MALVDLVERVRSALSVSADYDAQIEAGIKSAGRRLLRDYNFPKQIVKLTYPLVAAGSQYLALPADFKKPLGVRLSQFEEATTFWSEPLTRAEAFKLPSPDGVPRHYWVEGTNLWFDTAMPQDGLDVVLWYQSSSWDDNAAWLLADQEDTLFYFAMTRLAPEMRKKEVFEVFAPLWSDERQSLAIYLNELEWDDVTILMREPQAYVTNREMLSGLGTPSIFSLYGRAFVQVEDAAGARALLELGELATLDLADLNLGEAAAFDILPIANGGTGASDVAQAQLNLALRPGIEVQGYDADLAAIAAVSTTAYGRGFLGLADNAAARSYLSLGTLAIQNANSVAITGGSIAGITDLAVADGGTGASTAAAARTNLGLVIGTDVQAQDADLQAIAALSTTAFGRGFLDLADNAAARAKLSLGTVAVYNVGTSGNVVALLDGANSWSAQQVFSGNVGIGGTPTHLLTVIGTGTNARIRVTDSDTPFATALSLVEFAGSDGRAGFIGANNGVMMLFGEAGMAASISTGGSERVRIDTSGNVGIGTSSPGAKLDVAGLIRNVPDTNSTIQVGRYSLGYGGSAITTAGGATFLDVQLEGVSKVRVQAAGLVPMVDNSLSCGIGSLRWSVVYAGTGTINTSDEREKHWFTITEERRCADRRIADAILAELGHFQFLDAIEEKGEDGARWHFGTRAQRAWTIVAAEGLCAPLVGEGAEQQPDPAWTGPPPPAWLCFDEWGDQFEPIMEEQQIDTETVVVGQEPTGLLDLTGQPIFRDLTEERPVMGMVEVGQKLVQAAGNRFGLRVDQMGLLLDWEIGQRDKEKDALITDLTARIDALEAQ